MQEQSDFTFLDERFADIQLLRYQVPGFKELSLRQKLLIYHLSRAALLGRDILWDQNGAYNLQIRQVLEKIYTQYPGNRNSDEFLQFTIYLKRMWFSNGIHHHYGYQKFTPGFSEQFFVEAAKEVGLEVKHLVPILFDPSVLSKRVNQAEGDDLLLTSASNYYQDGITQAQAEAFYAKQKTEGDSKHPVMYGMNSRLEMHPDGTLYENVWRSGGLYGNHIDRIIAALQDAIRYAENKKQQAIIEKLIEFYQTGNLKTFDEYTILWVEDTESQVDFTNGFTEVYGDPLGLKASWEGYVNFIDPIATQRSQTLSDNAQWFEDHSPIDSRFRKKECRGVSAKVINAAILGGDLYPSSAIGINLPNSNWVRTEYGSKSVTIGNLAHAYDEAAKDNGLRKEFVIDDPTLSLLNKYASLCDDLHTDLHECLGHGSGQLLPGIDPDALKAYGSTIEEARADLFGLYYLADDKLVELGLTPNADAYKAQYYNYLMNGALTQLARIEKGNQIEEAHMRNRALITHWTLKNFPQAATLKEKGGKHYIQVHSYPMLRTAFATLLAEIQRIKSEGDLPAARELVEQFGVRVDPDLHTEVMLRYRALNLSPYKGFINPEYELVYDENGNISDVQIRYGETFEHQMLRYGKL
ncbi:MAG: dihydrofolate reductase [Bacteroidaceae bacterium]|nr:dihydrofolate reductase [Bacteroidaceae bacterium]